MRMVKTGRGQRSRRSRSIMMMAGSGHACQCRLVAASQMHRKLCGVIRAVVFDVGECLVDESREYGTWADWLGVPRHTFSAMFGAVIAQGLDYRDTFKVFRPDFDLAVAREHRTAAGKPEWFGEDDLYPDVRPTLAQLRELGLWVGIAGNQTVRAGGLLRSLDLPSDLIATSDDWGVSKPDPGFFEHVVKASPCAPE